MFFHVRSDLLEKTSCMFYTAFWTELTSSGESSSDNESIKMTLVDKNDGWIHFAFMYRVII